MKTFEQEKNFNKGNPLLSSFFNSDTCAHLIGVAFCIYLESII